MGSRKRISKATAAVRNLGRNSCHTNRRLGKSDGGCRRGAAQIDSVAVASVTEKLEALKSLIPSENKEMNCEQLFQETADYIVHLKTQVFVLEKLIDFYGSQ